MIKNCVFHPTKDSKDKIVKMFDLKEVLMNSRTSIYQNNKMRFSFDKNVTRVLIFDDGNVELIEKIRNYFYGEEYGKI